LSSAENNDGVGRMEILFRGFRNNLRRNEDQVSRQDESCDEQYSNDPMASAGGCGSAHPRAKNSDISCAGIAPSRIIFQRASSSVKSIMVEETSRGEGPPSTMIEMRS
jgi:hypothetical protein